MKSLDFLKKAEYYGMREFREHLTELLENPRSISIVGKRNHPTKAVLPYGLFLEFLTLYEEAETEGRIDPEQKWYWSEAWQKRMQRARRDVREGRLHHADTMEQALKQFSRAR